MKQASYEDEFGCGVCPILEDSDLDAMTDDQLQEELGNWSMSCGDDDPFALEVEGNYRLVERHIALRAMSDEAVEVDAESDEEFDGVIVTPEGIFLFPSREPADMPHDERTQEEVNLWWGRPFITEGDGPEPRYYVQCLDGGAWDRPTLKGCSHSVSGALSIARSLLA